MPSVHLVGPAPTGWGEAWFTEDRRYRWKLRRSWPPALGGAERGAVFAMCNPSDASHRRDDATVRRCAGYAKAWGCAYFEAVNLSPKVAHRPPVMLADLAAAGDPPWWHEENMRTIVATCAGVDAPAQPLVVLAWGGIATRPAVAPLAALVRDRLALEGIPWHALGFTKDGEPKHPLFQPAAAPLLTADGQPWPF